MSAAVKSALSADVESRVSLLIIDDHSLAMELLANVVAQPGVEVLMASGPEEGLDLLRRRRPQIVITDLTGPGMNSIEVLERIMEIDPATNVVLLSADYSTKSAIEAVKKGATDYLHKPVSDNLLRERIGRLVEESTRRQRALEIEDQLPGHSEFEGIIGRSPQMREMFRRILRIAPHYRTALITGETGTGKDLIAGAIHNVSPVSSGRYVVLNCSAVVETLFESELFGHVRGAFTGATQDKPGLFEHAHRGTLFLDEIGDMPLATQAKLLRVLQNREVQRVGALSTSKVDVRVLAATNHNLRAAVEEKRFREDLYYRLSMVEIRVPRLVERKEDLPLLQRHFLRRFSAQYGKEIRGLTHRAQLCLAEHSWPGNVRELENVIGHAMIMTSNDVLDIQDLPQSLRATQERERTSAGHWPSAGTLAEVERDYIIHVLGQTAGVVSAAATQLGVKRTSLYALMRKLNISRKSWNGNSRGSFEPEQPGNIQHG
jgi:two-component system, NtrC family, response regulator HydG